MKDKRRSRPKERIDEVLDLLEEVWRDNPDMRFGQLIINIAGYLDSGNFDISETYNEVDAEYFDSMLEDAYKIEQSLWNVEFREWKNAIKSFKSEAN